MKLSVISEDKIPIIKRILYRPAALHILFPSGDVWEYVLYDDMLLRQLLHKYRFNIGRLLVALKKMKIEARKL